MASRASVPSGHPVYPLIGTPRRIAIFRALQLGDLLCAIPAIRSLRLALPEAHMTLIGLPWARALAARFAHYFDDFLEFPGYPGLPERTPDLAMIPRFLTAAQQQHFDLVVQLHGSGGIVNPLVALLGGDHTAGFFLPGQYCPDPARFIPYPDGLPEIHRHLRLMQHLGLPATDDALEFPLYPADFAELAALPQCAGLQPGQYVCIHPGARHPDKRWPPALFAQVADQLYDQGYQVVLTGSQKEQALTQAVARQMRAPSIDTASPISIGGLAALLSQARLLVSNDTGVSHIAAALQLPSVVIFFATDPARWAPLQRHRHRVIHEPGGVQVPQVIEASAALLEKPWKVAVNGAMGMRASAPSV